MGDDDDNVVYLNRPVRPRLDDGDTIREFVGRLVHTTSKAWLVDVNGNEVWLPRSRCVWVTGEVIRVPVWLAKIKGLV
jgi:hypothetical protein